MDPVLRVGARFAVERLAGEGGMGTVYRALDREAGGPVAVKVLQRCGSDEQERFAREARVLAELRHPAIVRYVAHGTTEEGRPYLAMEWLEGEDLGARLARTGLTIAESVLLIRQVAGALAEVHAMGVVHRDIKPSNLFLLDGDIGRLKLLDFGIARLSFATRPATRTGMGLGTPGYMAPEQARGARDVDERADIFSLGCVLFECLTGRPAFQGAHVMAVLAKVLFEEAPRVSELRPGVPAALEVLVELMLRKEPIERLASATKVAEVLGSLGTLDLLKIAEGAQPSPKTSLPTLTAEPVSVGLTEAEQRFVSVLLIRAAPSRGVVDGANHEHADLGMAPTLMPKTGLDAEGALRAVVALHGGCCDGLADGTWVVTLEGRGSATDQAARAARCALAAVSALPECRAALATGRGRVGARFPVGEAIDRAARLLRVSRGEDLESEAQPSSSYAERSLRIDELTAGLLDPRFRVDVGGSEFFLRGQVEASDDARTLLGKRTPFVGRDWEIRTLDDMFDECASEPAARVVLITARAGTGKSRLCYEFLQGLKGREPAPEVWIARGDPIRFGAPFGLLLQVIRRAARIADGEPLEDRRQKLRARVRRHVATSIQGRVTEFLGEMVGTPLPDEESVQLRAARLDPMLMRDQIGRAWIDFIEAECRAQPVLLVLEDLHWGDAPTTENVDAALRLLKDRPLMVLAIARPEVRDRFPKLWAARDVMEVRLPELSRKACNRLIREVLGEEALGAVGAKLWGRSEGNAFFLEELMRAVAEGRGEELPETVVAMMQSRLEALDPEARRVLRAGSVFGQVFWRGAVTALLGGKAGATELAATLEELERREVVTRRSEAAFQGEMEYVFRHALVRDAAYGMLTDEDRTLGHRLAGEWLVRSGARDAFVIAEHFDRGGDLVRAAELYRRAAEQALEGNDLPAVIECVERAMARGVSPETRGELSLLRAKAHTWRGEFAESERWAVFALETLPKGIDSWFDAVEGATEAAARLGHAECFDALLAQLSESWSCGQVRRSQMIATVHVVVNRQLHFGECDRAMVLEAKVEAVAEHFLDDPAASAHVSFARACMAMFKGDLGTSREEFKASALRFERAGDMRQASLTLMNTGAVSCELGEYEEGVELLTAVLADAERMGLQNVAASVRSNLGIALARLGSYKEARGLLIESVAAFISQGDARSVGCAHAYLASVLESMGELERAEVEAQLAVKALESSPPCQPLALAMLARLQLARGHTEKAAVSARQAVEIADSLGHIEEGEALVRLTFAETLHATGDRGGARAAIAGARDRLLERASKIANADWRRSFRENVPENARTFDVARRWLDELGDMP